jgi:hypothetical protein
VFQQAGSQYDNGTMDNAILGCASAIALAESYHQHPWKPLFNFPVPGDPKPGSKKRTKHLFVHDEVGGELMEITNNAMSVLLENEKGDVITRKHPTGDFQLLTKDPPILLGIQKTDLTTCFKNMEQGPAEMPRTPNTVSPDTAPGGPNVSIEQPNMDPSTNILYGVTNMDPLQSQPLAEATMDNGTTPLSQTTDDPAHDYLLPPDTTTNVKSINQHPMAAQSSAVGNRVVPQPPHTSPLQEKSMDDDDGTISLSEPESGVMEGNLFN